MLKYIFKDEPALIKNANRASPQKIGEALAAIAAGNKGRLLPRDALNAARNNKKHPLYKHIEWDNEIAAEAYRLDQVREIIRIVRVENEETESGTARAFVSVQDHGVAYRQISEIKTNADLQNAVLKAAERDLAAWQARYRELVEICQIVADARERLREKMRKLENRIQ